MQKNSQAIESVKTRSGRLGPKLSGRSTEDTGLACPLCRDAQKLTVGKFVPQLKRVEGDRRAFCLGTHGWITEGELATADPFTRNR